MKKGSSAIFFAIFAAALYAINVPVSKILIDNVSPVMLAGLLYIGAGVGIGIFMAVKKFFNAAGEENYLERKDLPYTVGMVVLDIIAPIFLMYGISNTTSANVSLLNNFEIVATSVIALAIFKEKISKKLWIAIGLVTLASIILGFEGAGAFVLNKGSLFVMAACLCWGLENNCTRSISDKNPEQIVLIKGMFSGMGGIAVAILKGDVLPEFNYVMAVIILGFISYGLSIKFYIMAQKVLGAAKTSAFYSVAPFLGVGFGIVFLNEKPHAQFYVALIVMIVSSIIMVNDTLENEK